MFVIRFKDFVYINDKDVCLEFTYENINDFEKDFFRFLMEGYVLETYRREEE
jgi:hypothetical protein